MENLTTLILKLPRDTEVTPEAAQTFLASLTQIPSINLIEKLRGSHKQKLSLEILLFNQQIQFQVTCSESLVSYVETQIQSTYPLVVIQKQKKDPLEDVGVEVLEAKLKYLQDYPIATYNTFKDVDPISSILSVLAKSEPDEITIIQFALAGAPSSWRGHIEYKIFKGIQNKDGTRQELPDKEILKEKISFPGFNVSVRIASNKSDTLKELTNAFEVYTKPNGNSFRVSKPIALISGSPIKALRERRVFGNQILNIMELATLWHLPSGKIKTPTIAWGVSVLSEPPDNLPAAITSSEEIKKNINFFAKTVFKNKETIFGIKNSDRRRHIWCIGKSGTGKSTLIANMAVDDFKKDRGLAVIDPHGDLIETLLDYIPRSRINDVVYFNPADKDYPIIINSLEVMNKEEEELVVSGIVSIFYKIFGHSWGPRLEYILRNTLLTLTEVPGSTLNDVITILTNKSFRNKTVSKIEDQVLKHFWIDEYDQWRPDQQQEVISPILNKVGQFVSSPLIRRVIGSPKSSINIESIMNEGKILMANLSQGRLGEDNSSLLGAMLITKLQLSAMHRVTIPERERKDFYLYVDEFQNFATTSFIKILSESRKYRLSLMLANQYTAQIPEDVKRAILGNAGTIISFTAGADDAATLKKEFAETFSENDLINLDRYQIAVRLTIDDKITRPFLAHTLPLAKSVNQNREKVIKVSRERWARKTRENGSRAQAENSKEVSGSAIKTVYKSG